MSYDGVWIIEQNRLATELSLGQGLRHEGMSEGGIRETVSVATLILSWFSGCSLLANQRTVMQSFNQSDASRILCHECMSWISHHMTKSWQPPLVMCDMDTEELSPLIGYIIINKTSHWSLYCVAFLCCMCDFVTLIMAEQNLADTWINAGYQITHQASLEWVCPATAKWALKSLILTETLTI